MTQIGLLDCNNFFVSCERLFRPDLIKQPVAVLSSNDGCIVARSNEVKAMGIPMGIPLFQAKQLVDMSSVHLFSSNFTLYRDISTRVMSILKEEVGQCEVYSIDEAFFAATDAVIKDVESIRYRIMQKTGIPVSIGIAATKTLAKEASKIGKKGEGVCVLSPELWKQKASGTPCSDIWGLGRATVAKLAALEVRTAGDFMALERSFIRKTFGVGGERIYDELKGTAVHALGERAHDSRQSVTSSRSFATATREQAELESAVAYHVAQVSKKLREQGLAATMMYVELRAGRHSDFSHRRGGTEVALAAPTNSTQHLTELALQAVAKVYDPEIPYKKAGVVLSGLVPEAYISGSLFEPCDKIADRQLDDVLDNIHQRFGFEALHSAAILPSRDRSSVKMRSGAYTTTWKDIPIVKA